MIFNHPFWGAFFGVFAGIISGVAIYYIVGWINSCIYRGKAKKNLKFEIDYNIKHIDSLSKELQRFRNKANADDIKSYVGHFFVSKVIMTQLAQMFFDRTIYKCVEHEDIAKLQIFSRYFSTDSERIVNDLVNYYKQNYVPGMKAQVTEEIDYFEKILDDSKTDLQAIHKKL